MHAGTGPDIDNMIGVTDGVLVVLHYQHGIAEVAQVNQRLEQALVIPLMEADGGFIEDIHDADQPRPDLAGQADALGLAARERLGAAVQAQIIQADINQKAIPRAKFFENFVRNFSLPTGEIQLHQNKLAHHRRAAR